MKTDNNKCELRKVTSISDFIITSKKFPEIRVYSVTTNNKKNNKRAQFIKYCTYMLSKKQKKGEHIAMDVFGYSIIFRKRWRGRLPLPTTETLRRRLLSLIA